MLSEGYSDLSPVYPLIAQQILDDYQIQSGICLDIGTGPGYMGIELAKISNLEIYFVDIKGETLIKTKENVTGCNLDNRLHYTEADVSALPFENNFADLIVSRGSLWFWADQIKGLQEIYRVLRPGGVAFTGGGIGRYTPLSMRMRLKEKGRRAAQKKNEKANFLSGAGLQELLDKTGLYGCRTISDVEGEDATWIEMRK
ncbi:MAG: class I SAM-dependent methyltransferase [Deltaproteobacteria bacterium]|nr:class I SAM-dependent methyltransferase [Deltaproteobacteria bacterium]